MPRAAERKPSELWLKQLEDANQALVAANINLARRQRQFDDAAAPSAATSSIACVPALNRAASGRSASGSFQCWPRETFSKGTFGAGIAALCFSTIQQSVALATI
jgi:hypothetical protein